MTESITHSDPTGRSDPPGQPKKGRRTVWQTLSSMVITLPVVVLVYFFALSLLFSPRPKNLGAHEGRLRPCPSTPNCVCSQDSDAEHAIAPISFTGDADAAWERLRQVITSQPRAKIIRDEDGYLHAEFTSAFFRFTDDLECVLDRTASVIHVRSAARVGYSDIGVNRARVETLRTAFESSPPTRSTSE